MEYTFSDGTILIRPYCEADADSLFTAVRESISELSPWLTWCHADYDRAETIEFLALRAAAVASDTDYGFGIFESNSERFLGGVGLNQVNRIHQVGNLGYWVRTSAARRGIASRAALLMSRFGFLELRLNRIEILADVANVASQRVAEKLGATREGILRRRLLHNGATHDAVMFSLIAEDLGLVPHHSLLHTESPAIATGLPEP